MDTLLEGQLSRMEDALSRLLTTIITYNPSLSAADELLHADDELSRGLETLTRHQSNYTRILQLRHEAALLDSKIKTSVQLLADVRKALLAVPLDTAPKATTKPTPVPYKTLLTYAKNIAPFTIPPTFRPKPHPPPEAIEPKPQESASDEAQPDAPTAPQDNNDGGGGAALKTLTPEQAGWIAELSNLPFQPWPGEAEMANGALHVLNMQVVAGHDPTDLAKVLDEEREREAEEVRKREEEAELERRRREREGRGAQRPVDGIREAGMVEERERARFGLDDDDDDED